MKGEQGARGCFIRWCQPHQWISETLHTYDELMQSHATSGHSHANPNCLCGRSGHWREMSAAEMAQRLPAWARPLYWARKGDEYFASQGIQ